MKRLSKKQRETIKQKYGGLCAYSGTPLEDDWEIDHIQPIIRNPDGSSMFPDSHCEENMVPCQKIINHYKGSLPLVHFRNWFLGGLHERLEKPKNPRTEKSRRRKEYLSKVASYFRITPTKPFEGVFYFEKQEHMKRIDLDNNSLIKDTFSFIPTRSVLWVLSHDAGFYIIVHNFNDEKNRLIRS